MSVEGQTRESSGRAKRVRIAPGISADAAGSWRKGQLREIVVSSRLLHGGSVPFMAHLRLTVVLNSGARIGPGKAALLESVHSTGSISGAARAMGMDYKRAWLLIDSLNQAFVTPAVERTTGGTGGGGAVLTPFGEDLLRRYRELEAAAGKLAGADLKALERQSSGKSGAKI